MSANRQYLRQSKRSYQSMLQLQTNWARQLYMQMSQVSSLVHPFNVKLEKIIAS